MPIDFGVLCAQGCFGLDRWRTGDSCSEHAFFPVALNYIADLQWNDTACWAASCRNYERADRYRFSTRDSSLMQIENSP